MTMPHMMNCEHRGSGWCLTCVGKLEAENVALRTIVDRLKAAELGQTGWEDGEHIVTLNGKPVGATITRDGREFDRWWPAVKRALLAEAAEGSE